MPLGTVWSPEEDERLAELVRVHGPKKWCQIASDLNTNKGSKQCRRRWKNFLSLDERKLGSWTPEEDAQLLECHKKHGNKWTQIAQEIGGRTDNAVKNRWAALEKKRRLGDDGFPAQQRSSFTRGGGGGSDLLGVRRIIAKDQPQRSFSSSRQQQAGLLEAEWMEALGSAAAAAAAAAAGGAQQPDQGAYALQPAAAFAGAQQPGDVASSMPMAGKPDLKINIPGATAPELPYSQRSQAGGADPSRMQKGGNLTPVEAWLGSGLNAMDQGKGEDDALLSTSRQGAHAAMAGLATPSEEPSTINELYKWLYGATPAAQQLAAGAAAAAAAAASKPGGPPAPWRDSYLQGMPHQQQQQQVPHPQMLPPSSGPYMGQQQQQLYQQQAPMSTLQDAGPPVFMQQQQQQPGRMVPPPGMHYYSQLPLQQPPMHALSKLSRTVSGFDPAPHHPGGVPQPQSLPEGMMLRQGLPPPQPRFVPQGPPSGPGMGGLGGGVMSHSGTAVTTAAGGFQPSHRPVPQGKQMQGGMPRHDQQQHDMMHRQPQLPVLSQQLPAVPPLMPQEPLLPAAQHLQPPAQQHWGAEDLKQLLELLGETAAQEVQQQQVLLAQAPPLCHLEHHPDEQKLEHANNVTGSMAAAT